jgi:hypothetical protein
MRKLTCLLAIAALAGASHAATLSKGTRELVVNGMLDPDGAGGTELNIGVGFGYFVQDNIELGAEGLYQDNGILTTTGLAGFGEYNFDLGTPLVPFVGAKLGWFNANFDSRHLKDQSAVVVECNGGAKYYLAENVALSAQLNVKCASEDIFLNDDKAESVDVNVTLGMRFFLP